MPTSYRLRVPELLRDSGMTAYGLAKASADRISISNAYRLADPAIQERAVDLKTLAALADVFGLERLDQLVAPVAP